MRKTVLVVSVLAVIFGLTACKKEAMNMQEGAQVTTEAPSAAPAMAADKVVLRVAKADEVGKEQLCPVMNEKFKVSKVTQVADYKGKSYYFCCAMCPGQFEKNPEKYAK
ncbi:MAG: hypothetical protein A2252_09790 [Elusimicrobia bacterium RIFOXYA2_FULL_39_19]|nr:MAG: hypothetical protein A2252_09790 [Elusimicrobia bacterium RIFOXYA2_FULL_39_19]